MKNTTFDIARAELRMLFCSPIAWLILIIFVVLANMVYMDAFQNLIQTKAAGYDIRTATDILFNSWRGVFTRMIPELYLYIPLLTMGAMSRELSSGSINLLYSSPVRDSQIILGKYLALVIYCFILLSVILLLGLFSLIFVQSAEIGMILSGFLGMFLLMCTYAAIGLFISSMTSYQVVAAIGTLAVLALLNLVGSIGQGIGWVRDITYWLSISDRATDMTKGLIGSNDVIYFIVVSGMFLSLSIVRLRLRRTRKTKIHSIIRYAVVVCLFVGIGYVFSLPKLMTYYDATSTKAMSLTPVSQKIMSQLKGTMTMTTYVNFLDENYALALPSRVNSDMRRFDRYRRYKPDIKMKYVYYYDSTPNPQLDVRFPDIPEPEERARIIARSKRYKFDKLKKPEQMRQIIDLSAEENRFVRHIVTKEGNGSFLRIFKDIYKHPSETEISAAMKRLLGNVPVMGFLTGHGERSIKRYGDGDYYMFASSLTFRNALINQGFDTREVFLERGASLPADLTVLVVSDLREPLEQWETDILTDFIDNGGNMILAVEPERKDNIRPIAEKLGIRFGDGIVVRSDDDFAPDVISCLFTPPACEISARFARLNAMGARFMVNGSGWIEYDEAVTDANGFAVLPIIAPDSGGCWNELETRNFDDETPELNENAGEKPLCDPAVAMVMMRRIDDRNQSILVLADADCIGNGEFTANRQNIISANYSLILQAAAWVTDGEYPVNTSRPPTQDNDVRISERGAKWAKIFLVGVLPAGLLTLGIIVVVRRTRK